MLKKSIDAKVRPLANATLEKASLLGAARIYVNKDALISLTGALDGNKACYVERLGTETETEEGPLKREASLCVMPDKNLSPNVVVMTRAFQDATGFKIGDQVRISLTEGNIADADEVVVQDVTETPQNDTAATHTYIPQWEYPLAKTLDRAELIFPDMLLQGVATDKLRRNFKVLSVNSQRSNLARYKPLGTVIRIAGSDEHAEAATFSEQFGGELVIKDVPGLVSQVKKLNAFLKRFSRSFGMPGERKSCGIVIHGGHNTGKTFILQRLADTRWGKVHWIRSSDKLATIRETFKQATSQQPSMVLIDSLDELIVKDRANRDAVIETICDELDALSATALAQNALPRTVVVATCLDYMTDVPEKLQKSTRLYKNIALPVPRMEERLDILKFLDPPIRPEEKEATLLSIAQNTHAYNGGDLEQLVTNAKDLWGEKFDESGVDPESLKEQQFLTREDMEQALRVTRPTAMHDVNLKPPTVHWQDVGGQESLKKVLTRMIKNTKDTNPEARSVLQHPPKGLLLYGPPGCSKTLSAQAMATESSFNFFAVKGAELLNMYVGESERAVRMLFERARAASPSIIFFDEIDSIGGQRPGGSGGGGGGGSTIGVNVLTTLLTEMDGFESLTGVLVLAATNRPEAMDPALMRPGRFDQVLYVGPPDQKAREAVFQVHLRGLSLSEDVDISGLAEKADGYSGAEIKAICIEAGMAVLDRYDDDETGTVKLEISMADLVAAMERTPKKITQMMIHGYETWSKQFK